MSDHLLADPRALSTTLLERVRLYHRRSLDRTKFWNSCAQSRDLAAATREFCRGQRQMESDYRRGLKQLRLELSRTSALTPGSDEFTGRVTRLVASRSASNSLTCALTGFVVEWAPDPVPEWFGALRLRSPWLDLVIEEATGHRTVQDGPGKSTEAH